MIDPDRLVDYRSAGPNMPYVCMSSETVPSFVVALIAAGSPMAATAIDGFDFALELDEDGSGFESIGTLREFIQANPHLSSEQVASLFGLAPGGTFSGDEGAGGTWTVRRST